ncbi:MAG: hypothetical protein HY287_10250 [Planctomycetes bacterium]|nr:hypothetical protein [Planctomycetota bacterium]MBI3834697.1 hypothetical protein [Planctomycetota bacterium]
MRRIVLFEDEGFANFLPLTAWRTIFELQVGRKIMLDRIAQRLNTPISGVWVRDWMRQIASQRCSVPANESLDGETVLVNGRWLFDDKTEFVKSPAVGTCASGDIAYIACDAALARRISTADLLDGIRCGKLLCGVPRTSVSGHLITYPWDLIGDLSGILRADWTSEDATIQSELQPGSIVENRGSVHIGTGVQIHRTAVIDASEGPIYIGDHARVGPYAVLEGPLYLGAGTRVNPHAWLHGANAIGPMCKVGGEITGSVIYGYTNKQHEGFLGHAFVGSWVNIGASSVNSNLTNPYSNVKVPINGREVDSKQLFFGAVIGDHAKLGINTSLPTGAVIGFGASIAGVGAIPKFVPSFAWITNGELRAGDYLRAMDTASIVMSRRNVELTDEEVALFHDLPQRLAAIERASNSA